MLVAAHERAASRDAMSWSGRLLHIHIAKRASLAMEELDEAKLIAGRGIEGDRYFNGIGTYSPKPDVREVTLIEMEVLDAIARGDPPFPGEKVELAPGEHRRNLTTLGVPLNHLVGKRFKVGEAVLIGGRMNFPCRYLERLLGRPVYTALLNRSGSSFRMGFAGTIRKGGPSTRSGGRGTPARPSPLALEPKATKAIGLTCPTCSCDRTTMLFAVGVCGSASTLGAIYLTRKWS